MELQVDDVENNNSSSTLPMTLTGLLPTQSMLKKRYTLLSQAGRGGFGAVYKAIDTGLKNRLVAIKEMSQNSLDLRERAEASAAFNHEAMLLASLTHPNLPGIHDQFTEAGRSYLVMDFIEGETLEEALRKLGPRKMPIEKVLDIGLQLCAVLEYLHTRQPPIIFRDLKPANIMLNPSGHVYLIDFGIARHFKPGQKQDTTALGSSGYAPPEQYGKSQTTMRADIYSLGATLHQLLTGDDPSETPFRFAPLTLTNPALAGLETLILNMVSIDVSHRPESITQVRQELQRIASQAMIAQTNPLSTATVSALLPASGQTLPPGRLPTPVSTGTGTYIPSPPRSPSAQPTPWKKAAQVQVYPQANTLFICMGHSSRVTAVAWSPDGKYLASASYDKTVQIWNANNGSNLLTYKAHGARVNALSWSPDSKYLASASHDQTVQVWDACNGRTLHTYDHHHTRVYAVAWSPDGNLIASAGEDKIVQVWNASTSMPITHYTGHNDTILTLAWFPDSAHLASSGQDHILKIWTVEKTTQKRSFLSQFFFPRNESKTRGGFGGQIHALACSPDGRYLAAACSNATVSIREAQTGTPLITISTKGSTMKNTVAWSPNSKHLAIGGNDKQVRVWNLASRKETFSYHGHSGYVIAATWSPDGSKIASAGVDRSVQVWQAM